MWLSEEVKAKTSALCEKLIKQKQTTMHIRIKLIKLILRNFIYLIISNY
ncbi:hypothetical protein EV00_0842 [Prochlorococcus marinus str. MIT 9322]|nr:hypothetical protein EV00_0842 [Prochlorococcus marinus str. MIT 9322]